MSQSHFDAIFSTPLGKMGLCVDDGVITELGWIIGDERLRTAKSKEAQSSVKRIQAYFQSAEKMPELPLKLKGTSFQKKVWRALQKIPSGKTITYGGLAKRLNTSSRAIGQACRTNPVSLLVPCHRVVAQNSLGGYSGKLKRLAIKEWLLKHEGAL